MKKIFLALLLLCTFSMSSVAYSQSYYTTQSKSCGACGKEVSANSTVGMRCPHCERTATKKSNSYNKSYNNSNNYNYSNSNNNSDSYDMTPAKTITTASLRRKASAKSELLFNISKDRSVYIIGKKGSWYYVSCPTIYADEKYIKKLRNGKKNEEQGVISVEDFLILNEINTSEKMGGLRTVDQVNEVLGMKESPLKGYIHTSSLRVKR